MSSSIVKSAAQQLGRLMVEEAKYLYKVSDKIESLQMELAWMECFLRDADNQQHKEKVVCMWVSQVRDLAYDAEDIIERYLRGVHHHRKDGVRNTLKWFSGILLSTDARNLHSLGSKIDNMIVKMSELTSRLQRYGIQIIKTSRSMEYNIMMREERRTYSHTEEDVVGLEKDIQQVVDQLVNTEVKVVAISGTGGLGKTTLARKVFKHKVIKDHFNENYAWVFISKEFDNINIFKEILHQLENGEETRKNNTEGRKEKTRPEELAGEISKLLQGKKWLVVVDDIWDVKAWERLKPAFESIFTTVSSSSKILLTTRNQGLVQQVDPCGYLHLLQHLTEDDSWELLKRKAFAGGLHGSTDDGHMEKLGKEILEHCGGLPIAIITIGGILSTKKAVLEWEDIRKNISSYLMSGMEEEGANNRMLEILELSYNELPFYLKSCFLYLGNFPEDYEISTQKLYHLWEAEGFLVVEGEIQKKQGTSYDIGERYLNELAQRSMILVRKCWANGRIKTCQVHDVIRDMCLRKCEEVGFLSLIACTKSGRVNGLPPFSTEIKKLRRCAVLGEDEVDKDLQFGEKAAGLRSLLLFNHMVRPSRKIWESCLLLRVLDLERVDKLIRLDGMKCLIHLRYLSFRGSWLEEIPSCIFELQYLETFDLRHIRCDSLLSNKFYKMKRLKHLYLPTYIKVKGGGKLRFPSGGQMETIKNFDPSKCEAKEIMQMINLRVFSIKNYSLFEKAEDLKWIVESPIMKKEGQLINTLCIIRIQEDVIKKNPLILSPLKHHPSCFKELTLIKGKHVEKKGNSIIFPESLTRVVLQECDPTVEGGLLLDLEKLPHLQVLILKHSTLGEATTKVSFSPHSFPQLTEFCVIDPKRSFEWEVGKAAAPSLQLLKLRDCRNLNKLKNIPDSLTEVTLKECRVTQGEFSALEKLPYLKYLTIDGLGLEDDLKLLSFSAGSFPQLTQLRLVGRTEFEEWEVGEGALANLQSLDICHWERLKRLSFSHFSVPKLTKLDLYRLSKLEEWEVGEGALANLQTLKLWGLQRLKKVVINELSHSLTLVELSNCDILGEGGHVSLLGWLEKLPQLQKLKMQKLIKSTAGGRNTLSFSQGSFPQLAELDLGWCDELMEWEIGDGALPKLQLLWLRGCKKLNKLHSSLTRVSLSKCEIGEAGGGGLLLALENLPRLQQLFIYDPIIGEAMNKMSFSTGSFPQLTQLEIKYAEELEEWEVGDGALPALQTLELYWCKKLKKLPEGLPKSVNIKCKDPCIKGIENYNTCPDFKHHKTLLQKVKWWLCDSCP